METYLELKSRQEKEVNALPLGFAFNDKQFEEMKAKLKVKSSDELYRLGSSGGFYRKLDSDLITGTFNRHEEERQKAIFTENGINVAYAEGMFYEEMCNHEFGINLSGVSDVIEACWLELDDLEKHPDLKRAWLNACKKYFTDAEVNHWF